MTVTFDLAHKLGLLRKRLLCVSSIWYLQFFPLLSPNDKLWFEGMSFPFLLTLLEIRVYVILRNYSLCLVFRNIYTQNRFLAYIFLLLLLLFDTSYTSHDWLWLSRFSTEPCRGRWFCFFSCSLFPSRVIVELILHIIVHPVSLHETQAYSLFPFQLPCLVSSEIRDSCVSYIHIYQGKSWLLPFPDISYVLSPLLLFQYLPTDTQKMLGIIPHCLE